MVVSRLGGGGGASHPRERVAVTGACGYAGRALVRRLLDDGFDVLASDVAPPRQSHDAALAAAFHLDLDALADFVLCDVTSPDQCAQAVRGAATVFHVGALVPYNLAFSPSTSQLLAVNVGGTRNMLDAARAAGVRQFIYCSSTGVAFAGRHNAGTDEGAADVDARGGGGDNSATGGSWGRGGGSTHWNDAYSESKALAERLVLAANDPSPSGMVTLALRPNGIWGPGEGHHIPKVLVMAQLGLSGFTFGPHALTDWTHRDDLAAAFVCARTALCGPPAKRTRVSGRAFFVTAPWRTHTTEFFAPLLTGLGFPSPFPCAVVPEGAVGSFKHDGRLSGEEAGALGWAEVEAADLLPRTRRLQLLQHTPATPLVATVNGVPTLFKGTPSSSTPSSSSSRRHMIVLTAPPTAPLPSAVLIPVAALLQVGCAVLRALTGISREPFLTLSDVRKVVRHNYYDSGAARRELGWAPVTSPASGMLEMVAYYDAVGYDGRVFGPSRGQAAAVLGGMLANAALAVDAGGALSAMLAAVHGATGSVGADDVLGGGGGGGGGASLLTEGAALLVRTYNERLTGVVGALSLPSSISTALHWTTSPPLLFCGGTDSPTTCPSSLPLSSAIEVVRTILMVVVLAAVLCHALQGLVVACLAWRWRTNAAGWAVQSTLFGFPSTSWLVGWKWGQRAADWTVVACLASFAACIPVVAMVRAVQQLEVQQ